MEDIKNLKERLGRRRALLMSPPSPHGKRLPAKRNPGEHSMTVTVYEDTQQSQLQPTLVESPNKAVERIRKENERLQPTLFDSPNKAVERIRKENEAWLKSREEVKEKAPILAAANLKDKENLQPLQKLERAEHERCDVRVKFAGGVILKCVAPADPNSIRHKSTNATQDTVRGEDDPVPINTDADSTAAAEVDCAISSRFTAGDPVDVYSRSQQMWLSGKVLSIVTADDVNAGEILGDVRVCYGGGILKCVAPADRNSIRHKSTSAILTSIVPGIWDKVRGEDDSPMAVPLEATNPAHRELWDSICRNMLEVGEVICVARNENYDLWESFVHEKRKLTRMLSRSGRCSIWNVGSGCYSCDSDTSRAIPEHYGDDDNALTVLHERTLFHTAGATVETIFQDGFDSRLSNVGCFGRGVYFSDAPKKCNTYWSRRTTSDARFVTNRAGETVPPPGHQDVRVMFIAQVLLGEAKVYPPGQQDRGLTREPERENGVDRYDSVRGLISVGDEFVIYQNARAFPMFAVYYKTWN